MVRYLKSRWPLLLVLVLFVALKLPHLHYAYYWDESSPYAPAIKAMHDHGVTILPGAIDPELSRGHPLLFHALAAAWMGIFGDSHVAMHSFALCIALLLLVLVFEAGIRLFNVRVAAIAVLLIASQEVFFVQSTAVLCEVLLALFCFASIYWYARERYLLATVSLACLFLTKESGLIVGFVLGLDALFSIFYKDTIWKTAIKRMVTVGIPCILIGLFFVLQHQRYGWYIFPFHSGLIENNLDRFWYSMRKGCLSDIFYSYSKGVYFILLSAMAIPAIIRSKKLRLLAWFVPAIIIFALSEDRRSGPFLGSIAGFFVLVATWVSATFIIGHRTIFAGNSQRRFVKLTSIFVLSFIIFSSSTFHTFRYLLSALIPMLFIAAVMFDLFISLSYRWLIYPVLLGCLVISIYAYKQNDEFGDADLGAYNAIAVQQAMVDYLEDHGSYDLEIGTGSNLEAVHLRSVATGFLRKGRAFRSVKWEINEKTDFAVFDNIEPDSRHEQIMKDANFHLVYRFARGRNWGEIYGRKQSGPESLQVLDSGNK
jgi:4-amino-4-deoxy-L-arabinose transferase-like glycosyltransferase